ncbi:MAG: YceI family protein [Ferruginibacter sp.]
MKKTILVFALAFSTGALFAQKKTTTSATINFDATTEKDALPKAGNKTTVASLDTKKGTIAFETIIKNFSFGNPMMQEHFNGEQWMNSDKFATATFKGTITNLSAINFDKDGTYTAEVTGDLTLHGETKPVKTNATITIKDKAISAIAEFSIKLEDYKVTGGAIAAGKVAKEPKISVVADFK